MLSNTGVRFARENNDLPFKQGDVYMAFEYLEYDLWALANSSQVNLTATHIKTYMKQMLDAIAYMHTNKVSNFIWVFDLLVKSALARPQPPSTLSFARNFTAPRLHITMRRTEPREGKLCTPSVRIFERSKQSRWYA